MSYVGKVLWSNIEEDKNPKPYLCVSESESRFQLGWGEDVKGNILSLDIVDLECADMLTILITDIDDLIRRGEARWDDQEG